MKRLYSSAVFALLTMTLMPANATEINIKLNGIQSIQGQIGCSLFSHDKGFPMESSQAQQQWLEVNQSEMSCTFNHVAPGHYAIAVFQDLNANKRVDKSLLGFPKEPWGVSRNVRPTMRAPTFSEATFEVKDEPNITMTLEIAK